MGERIAIYSTKRFEWEVLLDGEPWDLTSGSITLYFRRPDGIISTNAASIESPATAGLAYFDCLTTTLNMAGTWSRWWYGSVAGVAEYSDVDMFSVFDPRKG